MNKLVKNLSNSFKMLFIQNLGGCCVNLHMATVAKHNKVIKAVVSGLFVVSGAVSVYMMNMWAFCVSAFNALKFISFKCIEIIFVTMTSHKFCNKRTFLRAVLFANRFAARFSSANKASHVCAARAAMFLTVFLNRMKLASAFGAWNCVKLWFCVLVFGLTRFAPHLKLVISAKLSRAYIARSGFKGCFHAPIVPLFGGKA
jgi:hypothetical protein